MINEDEEYIIHHVMCHVSCIFITCTLVLVLVLVIIARMSDVGQNGYAVKAANGDHCLVPSPNPSCLIRDYVPPERQAAQHRG